MFGGARRSGHRWDYKWKSYGYGRDWRYFCLPSNKKPIRPKLKFTEKLAAFTVTVLVVNNLLDWVEPSPYTRPISYLRYLNKDKGKMDITDLIQYIDLNFIKNKNELPEDIKIGNIQLYQGDLLGGPMNESKQYLLDEYLKESIKTRGFSSTYYSFPSDTMRVFLEGLSLRQQMTVFSQVQKKHLEAYFYLPEELQRAEEMFNIFKDNFIYAYLDISIKFIKNNHEKYYINIHPSFVNEIIKKDLSLAAKFERRQDIDEITKDIPEASKYVEKKNVDIVDIKIHQLYKNNT